MQGFPTSHMFTHAGEAARPCMLLVPSHAHRNSTVQAPPAHAQSLEASSWGPCWWLCVISRAYVVSSESSNGSRARGSTSTAAPIAVPIVTSARLHLQQTHILTRISPTPSLLPSLISSLLPSLIPPPSSHILTPHPCPAPTLVSLAVDWIDRPRSGD